MDPQNIPSEDAKSDELFATTLASIQGDAVPPDAAVLARLRAQSTEAFAATAVQPPRTLGFRPVRWFAAAAAMIVIGVGAYFWLTPRGVTLGQVVANSEQAETLHLRVIRGQAKMEFWHSRRLKQSRWDNPNGRFSIADGTKYWMVNEAGNEAVSENHSPSPRELIRQYWDNLGLPTGNTSILNARPSERVRVGGQDVLVFRVELLDIPVKVWLEARVDAETQRVQSIRTWREKQGVKAPFAELTVLAYDQPIDPATFAIADTLTEDGRIGKVTDVQGIVTIKPVLHERWTPVREHLVLKPGDWLRTDARGANATALRLVKQTGVILGPKTLVELIGPKQIRLIEGEIEIVPTAKTSIELLGPDQQKITVKGRQFFRLQKQQLVSVAKDPPWLLGFKGATTNETLGSLVALVDGRNVPLTVGYHKVSVDVRDQIARTVVEESFVNHTKFELEGVFYFPLPQDASISGFGMWIGDNLVEADVVEKQRAREIYETILRERRDPGLLEWAGGNIFKARVFPIAANSEKRIKITYTQVLPLKGNRYRYSYALQSELLQQTPLRELSLDVKINSAVPLKSVSSPTHTTRDERTPHSAHVEFSAQSYTPTRDFEVVIEVEGRQSDVTMIPHRRGDDGYFMLQLTPPGAAGNWDRPLLPNGDPLNLLILADTSASIDAGQRATQAAFIGSLLSSLTPKDTFNLAACDLDCTWVFAQTKAADTKNVAAARDCLAARTSLGWTNLDAAFASALKQCTPVTHVIYVGDGIVTTGDADPVAFTKRLRRLVQGNSATFHAVTLGSSYESGVLKAIASVGGGSMRKITGEQGPATIARDLLGDIAQPALRDIKVEFKGFKAARIYPETLANVSAGSQQILLGRYLPEGKDQAGEVIVTGTQGGKPVRFSTRATLKDAEQGNSFIPRLWARMHLDGLLEQGSSEMIKDEIIALSEEYQIITPYTSLLVLETDADRQRFKVKRRFQMRDGERFFADGRDHALFDLAHKQIKKAGDWRTALRRTVLSDLAKLGREPRLFQPASPYARLGGRGRESPALFKAYLGELNDPMGKVEALDDSFSMPGLVENQTAALGNDFGVVDRPEKGSEEFRELDQEREGKSEMAAERQLEPLGIEEPRAEAASTSDGGFHYRLDELARLSLFDADEKWLANSEVLDYKSRRGLEFYRSGPYGPSYGQWLNTLFPPLPGAPGEPKEPKSTWPAAARNLANGLLRTGALAKMKVGVEITRQTDTFDARWGDVASQSRRLELVSAKSWLTRTGSDGGDTLVSWCNGKEIGVYSRAFQLGRTRGSTPRDIQPPPLELSDHSLGSLERAYSAYTPTLAPQEKDHTLLVLKQPTNLLHETRIVIDTTRQVIVSIENRHKDKVTGITRFEGFVEAGGSWWAQRIESTDADGKRSTLITQTVKAVPLPDLDKQVKAELAERDQMQFLNLPLPSVANAKKALATGKAGFSEHFVLLLHFQGTQQWVRVLEHLGHAEKAAAAKPGLAWVRSALLRNSRRHDELRQRYQADAARLLKSKAPETYFLADYIVGQSDGILQANEMLTLLDSLKAIYEKQQLHVHARKHWQNSRVSYLTQASRTDEAMLLRKSLAAEYPRDYSLQQQYARALAESGDYPAAYAWLTRVLVKDAKWRDWEEDSLRTAYTQLLQQQGRYLDLVAYIAAWTESNPAGRSAYEQHLHALLKSDQIEKADTLVLSWLKDAQKPGEMLPAIEGRLNAAVYFMLGNGYQLWTNRVDERWLKPLGETALYFARHETHSSTTSQILSNHQFQQSEEAGRVRKQLAGIVSVEIDKLPADQAHRLLGWVHPSDAEPAAWTKIASVLRQRWSKEADDHFKHTLGQALISILARHDTPTDLLTFLRLQRQTASEAYRASYTIQLFDRLLEQPWTVDFEAEAFTLLDKLSTAEDEGTRLFSAVAALHRLTDRLIDSRIAAQTKMLTHPEKLTRIELRKKQDDFRRLAREGVADRLRKEAAKHPKALAQWLTAESFYLDLLLDRNLNRAAAEAWELLGNAPAKKNDDTNTLERSLDEVLRQRYLVTLSNFAARKGADPALVDRLGKYIDQGITAGDARWKSAKFRLLIALDRSKDLEDVLRIWTREDDPDNRWRLALGYLLAEQGKLADAIREFEAVEADDELSPTAYRSLADWYLTQNQREANERAARAVYKTMSERQLSQRIAQKLHPWQRRDGHLPTTLDEEVLLMFAVLFEKSAYPHYYLHQLQQFYQASHDFRLLSGLPDAVLGHTATRVYPFVQGMQSVLDEVRDEATADEIVKRIAEVRPRAKSDIDKRALDLLEAMVERRAAEVQNQPGPHVQKALDALVRASKGKWEPGEPRLMADFLANLGTISNTHLRDEQMRQLNWLRIGESGRGTLDSLYIARRQAVALNGYQRRTEAIELLQAELDEFQKANDGAMPVAAHETLLTYVGFLEDAGHFARGEKVLEAKLQKPIHIQQRRFLTDRLNRLYYRALQNDGEASLGKGPLLYQALNAKIQKDLGDTDQNQRFEQIYLLTQVYRTAHEKKMPGVVSDLTTFAFKMLPPLLKEQTNYHETIVSNAAHALHDLAGPRDGIVFLLDRIEAEPRWLRYTNQDGWSRHGSTLAEWRVQAKDLGAAEGRLLKLVLTALRRDLETREQRSRILYYQHGDHGRFWKEKASDFAKVAESVLEERSQSSPAIQYIAEYFYWGLGQPKRATEILFVAHGQKILDEPGQTVLIDFLHRENRHGESIAVLLPLVERRPGNLNYRVQLMHAYFKTDRKAELLALLKATDTYYHEKDRWGEHAMDRLAHSTLQNELFEHSIAYFKELIPLHERTQPNRGIGNGTLANYYTGLANAYAGLKKTPEAVDAAGGAIVAWGGRRENRTQALDTLRLVLLRSPDLDSFVKHFDQQKQDSAIIRKALGQAYRDKKEHVRAIKQLEIAAKLQPNDAEIHQMLVASLDDTGNKEGAVRQLLQAVQLSRRELKLYEDLGKRYVTAGQLAEAERAYTSIVEMLPTESESHALLAEIREKQNRWPESIAHWEQVARTRALEPTGLLKLAAAQIHEKQWDHARQSLRKLDTRTWPPRFGDIRSEVRKLEEKLPRK